MSSSLMMFSTPATPPTLPTPPAPSPLVERAQAEFEAERAPRRLPAPTALAAASAATGEGAPLASPAPALARSPESNAKRSIPPWAKGDMWVAEMPTDSALVLLPGGRTQGEPREAEEEGVDTPRTVGLAPQPLPPPPLPAPTSDVETCRGMAGTAAHAAAAAAPMPDAPPCPPLICCSRVTGLVAGSVMTMRRLRWPLPALVRSRSLVPPIASSCGEAGAALPGLKAVAVSEPAEGCVVMSTRRLGPQLMPGLVMGALPLSCRSNSALPFY